MIAYHVNRISLMLLTMLAMMGSTWADINRDCPQFTAYGAPEANFAATTQQLCKKNYAVIHSCSVKNPVAVMEHVSTQDVTGPAQRRDDFREDPAVHAECRSTLKDYAASGYDRGHLVPAANNTQSADIMSESFFLSNMVPQVANNNRGIWRILELQVRDSVRATGQDLYVISGAVYAPGHLTIGNAVAVPTQLFKIIINKRTGTVTAFLMPNAAIPVADLPQYKTTLQAVEQASGMRFPVR
jgi:endonuclease G, mitochondrial